MYRNVGRFAVEAPMQRVPAVTSLCLRLARKGDMSAAIDGLWQLGGLEKSVGESEEDLARTKLVTASTLLAAMVRDKNTYDTPHGDPYMFMQTCKCKLRSHSHAGSVTFLCHV